VDTIASIRLAVRSPEQPHPLPVPWSPLVLVQESFRSPDCPIPMTETNVVFSQRKSRRPDYLTPADSDQVSAGLGSKHRTVSTHLPAAQGIKELFAIHVVNP